MIKTPVSQHGMFTSSFVDSYGCFLEDKQLKEAAKRINLHEELVEELIQVKQFLEDMHMMPVEWIMKESQYRHPIVEKLLEKCRE